MQGRLEWIGGNEVIELQEITTHFWCKEHDRRERHQKDADGKDVVDRVVRVERNAVQGPPVGVFGRFDFNAVRVVGAHFMQRNDVRHNQAQQNERYRDHVKAEEAVQSGVTNHKVATDQQGQIGTNKRNSSKQVNNHLRTPVTHLPPRQQVAHEGLSHQGQENTATKNPDQLTWLAVTAIHQTSEHVQVNDHKERRSTRGVHVADQPSPGHIPHDVFH